MMIYVNGQDIARLVLGGLEEGNWKLMPEVLEIRPEGYLSGLETWLDRMQLERATITGFVIVQGPGSATSLRTSHAMVNALAFALGVSVIALEKAPQMSDIDAITLLPGRAAHPFALPVYAHDPNITKTSRDALKRKTS